MTAPRPGLSGRPRHLTRRFVGSLRPGGPSPTEEAWVTGYLLPGEADLWRSMSGPDRRRAVAVARRVDRALGSPERPVLAAALLHDVGKVRSGLRTPGRVVATVVGVVAADRATRWATSDGLRGRMGGTSATRRRVPPCWRRRAVIRSPWPGPPSITGTPCVGRSTTG